MPTLKWLKNGNNYYYFKDAPVHISSITLNKSSISLNEVGQTAQLTATVSPDDAVEKHVYWSSSDITVATVSQTGLVTCVTPGSCTITAECDGVSATCEVEKVVYIDFLLIAGGGGGGNYGGGGAGGVIQCCCVSFMGEACITIGSGAGGRSGSNGGNSNFCGLNPVECFNYTAIGGGSTGLDGGSGGGGGSKAPGGKGTCGQGYDGGNGAYNGGGGGGGAGGAGCNGSQHYGGNGGIGIISNITGTNQCYAGGGGTYGGGGCGCGMYGGGNVSSGATTCGSGGGGQGGPGAGGLFVARYPTACGYDITGGCKYTCGDYTIHCFTSDGTLTVG